MNARGDSLSESGRREKARRSYSLKLVKVRLIFIPLKEVT